MTAKVRKELFLTTVWWRELTTMDITINEYQIYDLSRLGQTNVFKRRLLCKSVYHFFQDTEEDYLQKVKVDIYDNSKTLCYSKSYRKAFKISNHRRY